MVWDLLLKADLEGPTLIVTAASAPRLSDHNGHPFCVPPQHTVIAMQALGCENMSLDQPAQRIERGGDGAHGVGQGGERDWRTLQRIALELTLGTRFGG